MGCLVCLSSSPTELIFPLCLPVLHPLLVTFSTLSHPLHLPHSSHQIVGIPWRTSKKDAQPSPWTLVASSASWLVRGRFPVCL